MENKKRSFITVGVGSPQQREIEIVDFVQSHYKDNRTVTVAMLEDETYLLSVENIPSTGRSPQSSMWLSKDSFLGLLATSFMYFGCKGEDVGKMLNEAAAEDKISYSYSENIGPFKNSTE